MRNYWTIRLMAIALCAVLALLSGAFCAEPVNGPKTPLDEYVGRADPAYAWKVVKTIPGDGCVDFPAIFRILATANYRGWLVVEAEEDPLKVPALPKAKIARAYVRAHAGVAGRGPRRLGQHGPAQLI